MPQLLHLCFSNNYRNALYYLQNKILDGEKNVMLQLHTALPAFIIIGNFKSVKFLVNMYYLFIKNRKHNTIINKFNVNDRIGNSRLILPADIEMALKFNYTEIAEYLLENSEWSEQNCFIDPKHTILIDWNNGNHHLQLRRKEVINSIKFTDYVPDIIKIIIGYM